MNYMGQHEVTPNWRTF